MCQRISLSGWATTSLSATVFITRPRASKSSVAGEVDQVVADAVDVDRRHGPQQVEAVLGHRAHDAAAVLGRAGRCTRPAFSIRARCGSPGCGCAPSRRRAGPSAAACPASPRASPGSRTRPATRRSCAAGRRRAGRAAASSPSPARARTAAGTRRASDPRSPTPSTRLRRAARGSAPCPDRHRRTW